MDLLSLEQLDRRTDRTLLEDYSTLLSSRCSNTAAIVAHTAVIDARRLYRQAAYPSMYRYCIGEFHLSEYTAYKFIRAGRAARRFPDILPALATGRLHLTAIVVLAPYLTEGTADGLLEAATHKTRRQIEQLLAERFPKPDLPTRILPVTPTSSNSTTIQLAPPMKLGCPVKSGLGCFDPFSPRPSLTSRLFGVRTSAPGFAAEERGPTRGNGLRA